MTLEEIKKLANLARIDMTDNELSEIAGDFDSILAYVGQIQEASKMIPNDMTDKDFDLVNVLRDDAVTNSAGSYTDKITAEMPATENGYLKVKQIL